VRQAAIDNISAQTTVAARSGQTVVFAGLIKTTKFNETRGIPWLSQIPVAGHLFRYDGVSEERTELLIILTPRLVTGDEEMDWVKLAETERMSWCLSDVYDLWGPDTFGARPGGCQCESVCPTIYPMMDPLGVQPVYPEAVEENLILPVPAEPNGDQTPNNGDVVPPEQAMYLPGGMWRPDFQPAERRGLQPAAEAIPAYYRETGNVMPMQNAGYQVGPMPDAMAPAYYQQRR
jgi:hypothetical protein